MQLANVKSSPIPKWLKMDLLSKSPKCGREEPWSESSDSGWNISWEGCGLEACLRGDCLLQGLGPGTLVIPRALAPVWH